MPAGFESPGSILFVITSLFKDGAETQMARLAIAMARRGWFVSIVTLMDHNDFADELEAVGIKVESLKIPRGKYDLSSLPRLVRILKRLRPDIVCTFMYHANVLGRVAAKIAGVPAVVSSIRNAVFGGRLAERLMSITDGMADVTTTNSQLAADSLLARGVVQRNRLVVIPNAIEPAKPPDPGLSRAAAIGDGLESTWLWLSVGRLEHQKGHDIALQALANLWARGVDSHLLIAGTGSLKEELTLLRDELGLQEHVTFLGYRRDVGDLMHLADGFLLSSRWEGLPNVVMEACGAGLPVVATDVGGVREIIENRHSGLIVPADDPQALSDAMHELRTLGASELAAMSSFARQAVEVKFEHDSVMARWEALFLRLKGPGEAV